MLVLHLQRHIIALIPYAHLPNQARCTNDDEETGMVLMVWQPKNVANEGILSRDLSYLSYQNEKLSRVLTLKLNAIDIRIERTCKMYFYGEFSSVSFHLLLRDFSR